MNWMILGLSIYLWAKHFQDIKGSHGKRKS